MLKCLISISSYIYRYLIGFSMSGLANAIGCSVGSISYHTTNTEERLEKAKEKNKKE